MKKIIDFLKLHETIVFLIILLFFLIFLFVGGIIIGKNMVKDKDLKTTETNLKNDAKQAETDAKNSAKNAQTLIDSAGIFEEFARRQSKVTQSIHDNTDQVKLNGKTDIAKIDKLSKDSNVALFSKLGKEYIDSTK